MCVLNHVVPRLSHKSVTMPLTVRRIYGKKWFADVPYDDSEWGAWLDENHANLHLTRHYDESSFLKIVEFAPDMLCIDGEHNKTTVLSCGGLFVGFENEYVDFTNDVDAVMACEKKRVRNSLPVLYVVLDRRVSSEYS